ncbi:hypothetical protein [Verrucosispora sp. TAA-831]|uniref:hypothetical protein n=1 Tax=Verrucosispora sp. TAA-831 TaxID=3422227 RepID=UPI003D6FCCA8
MSRRRLGVIRAFTAFRTQQFASWLGLVTRDHDEEDRAAVREDLIAGAVFVVVVVGLLLWSGLSLHVAGWLDA